MIDNGLLVFNVTIKIFPLYRDGRFYWRRRKIQGSCSKTHTKLFAYRM